MAKPKVNRKLKEQTRLDAADISQEAGLKAHRRRLIEEALDEETREEMETESEDLQPSFYDLLDSPHLGDL